MSEHSASEEQMDRATGPPDGPLRVLVVDDDPELLRLLEPSIRAVDPEASVDWSPALGQAAFHLGLGHYDVVLVDWRLGAGQSGIEIEPLMERYQPEARFAVMTGASRSEFLSVHDHADWPFLAKPFTRDEGRDFLAGLLCRE